MPEEIQGILGISESQIRSENFDSIEETVINNSLREFLTEESVTAATSLKGTGSEEISPELIIESKLRIHFDEFVSGTRLVSKNLRRIFAKVKDSRLPVGVYT
jgi:hypothetical protein